MKRTLSVLLALLILFSSGIVLMAAELQPIAFTFTGRWQPSDDPVLIDDYGLQDIQNLRRERKHFKGVAGSTKINTTAVSSYPHILNGFHFRKDNPSESHVIILAATTLEDYSYLFENTTAIPSAGDFTTATSLHSNTVGMTDGRFSAAPNGNMLYANGESTVIWGGNESYPTAFIVSTASLSGTSTIITNPVDYSSQVKNTRQTADQVAWVNASGGVDDNVKLLLHGNGTDASTTITASETTAHAITALADAQIDTSQYKFASGSIQFDGTGDAIYAADSDDWNFGTGAFTVDFWVRFNALPAAGQAMVLFSQRSDADNGVSFHVKYSSGAPEFGLYMITSGTSTAIDFTTPLQPALALNTWYHIALVRTELGALDSWDVYLNGANQGTTLSAATYPDVTASFVIGTTGALTDAPTPIQINGRIDEFRISKGIARWTSDFTPPINPYAVAAGTFFVGTTRPIQGLKLYVADENSTTSTLTGKYWNGASWTDLTLTDNTSSGGISLAQTGTVTFTTTVGTAQPRYINGQSLYWYQFTLSAGAATIYSCTVDAPMQGITNIWDGRESYATKALKYATDYKDYTDSVNDEVEATVMDLSSMANTGYVLVGFTSPMQGLHVQMEPDSENGDASNALSSYYWSGSGWIAVEALSDGTATSTKGLNKSGVISWNPAGIGTEFSQAIGDESPLYYYKFAWAGTLDADTKISEIRGIGAPSAIGTYRLPVHYQNRALLMNEYNGRRNKIIYSMSNAPDVFNGSDTGTIYVGDETDITAAVSVYNIFANTAYDQLIIGKESEIWRLAGDDAENWTMKRISENVGCVAPLSMVSVEVTGEDRATRRQVAIFQGDTGFYMTDGATVMPISQDIKCYFDPNDTRYIPAARRTKTVAWYDPSIRSYKALISSGSTATYHNIELEYNLDTREWFKIYRETASGADPLQSGWRVWDTNGLGYTYGGNNTGQVYRLENGTTWAGATGITQYLWTKDLILDSVAPFFRKSSVKHMRVGVQKKTNGGTVSIAHYGDQVLTVSGSSNQVVPSAITVATAPYNTQSCNLGPFLYHSFKLTSSAATVADGMELTGIGLWVEPYTAIR